MSDLRVRRLLKELEMVRSETSFIEDVQICDGNVGKWQVICCTYVYYSHNTYEQVILKARKDTSARSTPFDSCTSLFFLWLPYKA